MAMMPATGRATTIQFVMLVPLTGLPAHAALLTKTMNAIVPAQTSKFDHRCDNPELLLAAYDELVSAVIFRSRVDLELQGRLVVVAVEGPGLHGVDALELAVDHLHADEARTPDLAADVDLGRHAVGVEVVHGPDRDEQVRPGDRVRVVVVGLHRVVDGPGEDLTGDECLRTEAVGALVVLEEGI